MDATFSALVAGFFSVILALVGGLGALYRQRASDREEDQKFRADLAFRLAALEAKLDRDYLLRTPHLAKHAAMEGRLDEHGNRIRALENDVRALKGGRA